MAPAFGLYFPYIHFRDDNWLKLSALYWSQLYRIVPIGYQTARDTDTVKAFDSSGYVKVIHPEAYSHPASERFRAVLVDHREDIQKAFGITQSGSWPSDGYTSRYAPDGVDDKFSYVFGPKMDFGLVDQLRSDGLVTTRGRDKWIGMHPRLAAVYMAILAQEVARGAQLSPISDDETSFSLTNLDETEFHMLSWTAHAKLKKAVMRVNLFRYWPVSL